MKRKNFKILNNFNVLAIYYYYYYLSLTFYTYASSISSECNISSAEALIIKLNGNVDTIK